MTEKKLPSAIVLPFGKHKGATVAELLTKDPAYAEWIVAQGWVAERFAELHAAILSRGAATDDSPEHNAIQVRFLDPVFRLACLFAVNGDAMREDWANTIACQIDMAADDVRRAERGYIYPETDRPGRVDGAKRRLAALNSAIRKFATSVRFEDRGVDVSISWSLHSAGGSWGHKGPAGIEIKPTMGDDFPSVMRQMSRLGCRILVVGEYTGRAVSEPQLRQMFAANNQTLLFIRDIEAEIATARTELAP
jgi:hypothetical protein